MKYLVVIAFGMIFSANIFAQTCAINANSQFTPLKDAVSLSACIAIAGTAAMEGGLADGSPQKIEFTYELKKATPGISGSLKPYKMTGEIILKPSIQNQRSVPSSPMDKR